LFLKILGKIIKFVDKFQIFKYVVIDDDNKNKYIVYCKTINLIKQEINIINYK